LAAAAVLVVPVLLVATSVHDFSAHTLLNPTGWSYNKLFKMPKFRSMRWAPAAVATHLLADLKRTLTPIGSFYAKQSGRTAAVVEHPGGDMSFVGPRPAFSTSMI
jgi:O-antigen biosynthesis protein WbqP